MSPAIEKRVERHSSAMLAEASPVSLTIPGLPQFFLVARMSARAVATCLEADFEEIEDLRLMIDEVCTLSAVGSISSSRMTLTYAWDDEMLEVRCTAVGLKDAEADDPKAESTRELSEMILQALSESHGIDALEHGTRTVWFRLRRPGL